MPSAVVTVVALLVTTTSVVGLTAIAMAHGPRWAPMATPILVMGAVALMLVLADRARWHGAIAARRDYEDRLRQSEERFRLLYENAPVAYQSLDENGTIRQVNQAWLDLLGYQRDHVLCRPIAEFVAPEFHGVLQERFARFVATGAVAGAEFELVRRDGHRVVVSLDGRIARGPHSDALRTHCVLRDITEARRAEREARRADAQLRQSQRMASLGTLAAAVAHEINNPVNVMMNYAQLIVEDAEGDHKASQMAREIVAEGDRIARIVRALYAYTHDDDEPPVPCRVVDLVQDALLLSEAAMKAADIGLTVSVASDLPDVRCRPPRVQQALLSLINNAIDALETRYPAADPNKLLEIGAKRAERDGGEYVRITVRDCGPGIEPHHLPHLFEPFFSTKPPATRSGLSLSIAHSIAVEHGGDLTATSQPGEGATFDLDLPADIEARSADQGTEPAETTAQPVAEEPAPAN